MWCSLLVACPPDRRQGTINCYSQEVVFNGIIKGNAGICLFGRHPISGAEDRPGKLHAKGHKVMELTLSRLTSVLQIAFFQFNNWY